MGLPQMQEPYESPEGALSPEEARRLHRDIRHWALKDAVLEREFRFDDFDDAMDFVNDIAALAREADHHPDIHISYNRVRVELTTHKVKGLTRKDFALAAEIDQLVA